MTEAEIPERLSGGSALGDALRALAHLRPTNVAVAAEILKLLQLKATSPPLSGAAAQPAPVGLPEEEPEQPGQGDTALLRLVSDAERLPEIVASEIEEVGDTGAAPPEWLARTSLIPPPTTVANPFRPYSRPPFEPQWQRAVVTRPASRTLPVGGPGIAP